MLSTTRAAGPSGMVVALDGGKAISYVGVMALVYYDAETGAVPHDERGLELPAPRARHTQQ